MRITDFDFSLPDDLIAQKPLENRDDSRMLIVERGSGSFRDAAFSDIVDRLGRRDLLILNNTKVFPARLSGQTSTGAVVEVFLIGETGENTWETLVKPLRRLKPGKKVVFGDGLEARTVQITDEGRAVLEFDFDGDFFERLETLGRTPIPPYIKRDKDAPDADRERYQTVFAAASGAIAAPTAGLHFTTEILSQIRAGGTEVVEITLHVGYGTFEPVRVRDLSEHRVLPERFEISEAAADSLNRARSGGKRFVAVGTTTTRTLEYAAARDGIFSCESGYADLTITPGYRFKAVGAMLTNFHLPKSSLLVLASTFAGHELIMKAYDHAVRERYRFYSYGDCMLIE